MYDQTGVLQLIINAQADVNKAAKVSGESENKHGHVHVCVFMCRSMRTCLRVCRCAFMCLWMHA